MDSPRISPGGLRELGIVNHLVCAAAGRVVGTERPRVFTTLGRRRGLFRAWLLYSAMLMPGGRLPRTDTELVILHVAAVRDCEYERRHHVRIARRVGLTREQVEHAHDVGWSDWTPRQRVLLTAAGRLVRDRDLDDATWDAVREHLDEATTIELLMLVGQYDSLATTLMTLRVQPEGPAA